MGEGLQYALFLFSFPLFIMILVQHLTDSDILHLHAAGRDIIVLNSFSAATALLDKKSAIYSSRCISSSLLVIKFIAPHESLGADLNLTC